MYCHQARWEVQSKLTFDLTLLFHNMGVKMKWRLQMFRMLQIWASASDLILNMVNWCRKHRTVPNSLCTVQCLVFGTCGQTTLLSRVFSPLISTGLHKDKPFCAKSQVQSLILFLYFFYCQLKRLVIDKMVDNAHRCYLLHMYVLVMSSMAF